MAIDRRDLAELQRLEVAMPEYSDSDLSALETLEEVIAWLIADARSSGDDEGDAVELFIRHAQLAPNEVRSAEQILRRLGYIPVADTMRRITGRRRHILAPL